MHKMISYEHVLHEANQTLFGTRGFLLVPLTHTLPMIDSLVRVRRIVVLPSLRVTEWPMFICIINF